MAKLTVQTKNRLRSNPVVEEEEAEETEAKAEPKVTVNKQLAKLMTDWQAAYGKAESYWPKIVMFVIENETSRAELKQALKDFRGLEVPTLNNELSVIMRVKDYPEKVQECLDGELSVRELREVGRKKQEGKEEEEPEERVGKLLDKAASFAIEEAAMEVDDFTKAARLSYKRRFSAISAKQAKAAAEAEEEGEEGEEEEEE